MHLRILIALLIVVCCTSTSWSQRGGSSIYGKEVYASFGYSAPIESANLRDVLAHSLTVYRSLLVSGRWMVGVNGVVGMDPEPIDAGRKQQLVAFHGFGRYYAQRDLVKGYAQVRVGPGFYRHKYNPDSADAPIYGTDWINFFFFNVNFGAGVDIALGGRSDWDLGFGMDYAVAGHTNGVGASFVPRITIAKYYQSKK